MDSKTRALIRSKATQIKSTFQIGKDGITENLIKAIIDTLNARELVKINVLKSCDQSMAEISESLIKATNAIEICQIGQKIVIYKYSSKKGIKHLIEN